MPTHILIYYRGHRKENRSFHKKQFPLQLEEQWRESTVEPVYNDIVLYDTSSIASYVLWYQLIPVNHNIILLGYNNTRL
jgi:hypothetical protein